ncbi:zinc finger BED domain-containing protein RICESLEEPER 2 [Tanacetum coccineum]
MQVCSFHFLPSRGSNNTLKNHIYSFRIVSIKGAAESKSGSGANVDGTRWANSITIRISFGTISRVCDSKRDTIQPHFVQRATTMVSRTLCNKILSYKPVLPIGRDTRWNSTFEMFESGLKQKTTLAYFHDILVNKNGRIVCGDYVFDGLDGDKCWPNSSVASESAFSTSGRLLTIRRTRLTPESLEMCMCLKDHLDAQERKQDTSPLELPLDVEENVI